MKVTTIVLTGFLGAGKTTLVNRLIAARAARGAAGADAGGGKLAIIVNELGAVGVDGDLLPRGSARQVELPGGCVCCVLAGDLERTVEEMLAANPDVDTLVLETTGVAEPLPIVWTLEREPLAARLRVAAVVTLVDPSSFAAARRTSTAAEIQVEGADVILLSKADVTAEAEREAARAEVERLAPGRPVLEGSAAEQVGWLLEVLEDPERESGHAHGHEHEHAHEHGDDCDDDAHAHAPGITGAHGVTAVAVPAPETVDLEQLEDELAALPAGYFRIKGIVHAFDPRRGERAPGWAVVHRVGARVSSEEVAPPSEPARLVALGVDVEASALAAALAASVPT
ncbi:MAG TPA: GTP-binding protein [Kofleriaceae bacterium]|nr:GTP-binding protein [Kofleriaceae bacterium]